MPVVPGMPVELGVSVELAVSVEVAVGPTAALGGTGEPGGTCGSRCARGAISVIRPVTVELVTGKLVAVMPAAAVPAGRGDPGIPVVGLVGPVLLGMHVGRMKVGRRCGETHRLRRTVVMAVLIRRFAVVPIRGNGRHLVVVRVRFVLPTPRTRAELLRARCGRPVLPEILLSVLLLSVLLLGGAGWEGRSPGFVLSRFRVLVPALMPRGTGPFLLL